MIIYGHHIRTTTRAPRIARGRAYDIYPPPKHACMFACLQTQEAYTEYCEVLRQEYCDEFWRVLSTVYLEHAVVIDRVLKTCRSTFMLSKKMRSLFDSSVRAIRTRSLSKAGDFPSLVMHEITVDLREFRLPGDNEEVKFRFVNPLWAWVGAANDMLDAGHKINFVPKTMYHERTGERLYGAGVAFGDKIKWAASRTPIGGKPALFGISFDGADSGVSNRNMYPVCVSVLNFDGAEPLSCGLVGYIPQLDVPKAFKTKKSKVFLRARNHVFQTCIGSILDEIENVSGDGFSAHLGGETMRLHPFLVAVRVDSKERKTYFGLKSDRFVLFHMITHIWFIIYDHHILFIIYDTHVCIHSRSCAICRFRKGWSSLRRGTDHGKNHIQRLWDIAIDTPTTRRRNAFGRTQKRAREQLQRHGFHKKQRCTLLDHAANILLRDPQIERQSLFANVIFNDLLHWQLNVCDYAFDAIVGVMTKEMQIECDENARRLPTFRKPDGTGVRRFKMVSENTYLTTARRLTLTFIWIHALGTRASMLPQTCRRPALLTLSSLQTIILACHGRRSYSFREWTRLLVDTSMVMFDCIQFLMEYQDTHDTRETATPFTPMMRCVLSIYDT